MIDVPKFELDRVAKPVPVLDDERTIEVVLVADRGDRRRSRLAGAQEELHRATGREVEQCEDQEGHRE